MTRRDFINNVTAAAVAAMFAFGAMADAAAPTVRVDPEGAIASPQQALAEVRRLRAEGAVASNATVTVSFAPGVYRLSSPLVIGPEDSNIVFSGPSDGKAVFSGARLIDGFKAGKDGIWRATVPKGLTFSQLWVNGRRATRARSPNKGYYYIREAVGEVVDPETGKLTSLDKRAYVFSCQNAAELASVPRRELKDVVVHAIYAWDDDFVRPTYADPKTGIVKFLTTFGRSPMWGQWMTRCRFENYRAALDEPGEWFLDGEKGELLYMPLPGQTPEGAFAEVPALSLLVEVKGSGVSFVENVVFRNIGFAHQGWTLGRTFFTGQAVCALDEAMVAVERSRRVSFDGCDFAHTSSYALWWREACFDGDVVRSHFHDLGSGGVRISNSRPKRTASEMANVTRRIAVDDCIIRDSGHVFPGGVGVLIQHAYDCRVVHNEIFDCLYTGVSFGWTWSYRSQPSGGHEIAFNHIHDLGLNEMCDMGGVYSLGPSPKSRVHDNWIHDIWSYQYTGSGGIGLYTDEGSTGVLFENNMVHDTQTSCLNQHYGRENVFRNNIFACPAVKKGADPQPVVIRHRQEPHLSCVISNNIVVLGAGRMAVGKRNSGLEKDTVFCNNLYVPDGADMKEAFAGLSFDEWRKRGMDSGSAVADARFRNLAKRDFSLLPDSPALALGFRPFDWMRAGLRGKKRRDAAARLPMRHRAPAFEPEYVPSKTSFNTSFEAYAPGAGCPTSIGPQGGDIKVTDRESHTGRMSLAYTDKPNGGLVFMPHSVVRLKRIGDELVFSFAIKYEGKTNFSFEMRDYGGRPANGQFATGPQVTINGGVLKAGGFVSRIAAPCKWITCKITHRLGPVDVPGRATWRVEVSDDTGAKESSETFKVNPDYRQPNWAGIMSWANDSTVFYIDDIGYEWATTACRRDPLALTRQGHKP